MSAAAATKDIFSPLEAPQRRVWAERVQNPPRGRSQMRRLGSVIAEAGRHPAVILDAAEKEELLVAALIARLRRPPLVLLAEATWKLGRNPLDHIAARTGLRFLDGEHVRYGVLSTFELESFPRTWRVDPERVHFTPYYYTLAEGELRARREGDGTIFAGGNSLRDYRPLVEAMRALPQRLMIATRTAGHGWARALPANVTVRATTPAEYNERTASASVVVVPLERRDDRSAGQATYLNAMALGKPVVVSDVAGARDYIADGETGILVPPGDPRALATALRALHEDPALARAIGEAARADVLRRFGPDDYAERLVAIVDAAI